MTPDLCVFALGTSRYLGEGITRTLGRSLDEHEEREFEDGEHKSRPLVSVRRRDVFVVQSLFGEPGASPNDKLCRLLFFIGALRDAGAERITAVVPYLSYGRKDRRTKDRDPITTRYVATLFEAVGVDRVVTMDAHNPAAVENAFRCGIDHLEAAPLLLRDVVSRHGDESLTVVSPDVGGVKRAEAFRLDLEERLGRPVGGALMEKRRSAGVVSGTRLVGEVRGTTVLILDDMMGTGTTIRRAAAACVDGGADRVVALATHGLFLEGAVAVLDDPELERMVVTNTVRPFRLPDRLVDQKVTVLDISDHLGQVIRRMHEGGSLLELQS
jgi:ribose-phosphate pyrophosphokinase